GGSSTSQPSQPNTGLPSLQSVLFFLLCLRIQPLLLPICPSYLLVFLLTRDEQSEMGRKMGKIQFRRHGSFLLSFVRELHREMSHNDFFSPRYVTSYKITRGQFLSLTKL